MSPPGSSSTGTTFMGSDLPQRKVSPFAATEIGLNTGGVLNESRSFMKQHFREEAHQVTHYLKGVHHARKIGHMQVNYSETVEKMSKGQTLKDTVLPSYQSNSHGGQSEKPQSKNSATDQMKYHEFMQTMNACVAKEQELNHLKRMHNREVGRKAVLREVMDGTAPMPKVELYPQGVKHTQMLAMTGTLAMPSPHIIPPKQPPRKKWLGEGVGWGPTPRADEH
jgi:hypothetical protein